ncbi:ATP-binding protein [Olivibacter sp. SDN3]|uniref:AAA family ATPase n=1 Tax=Olivibacter sp. SDN3 TaxID=2764720 RepID=UPI0016519245|nr:ATP-binding protein [Olivibacter sp. SDN3]QNL50854.1 ATP-binding protein [Olivibacter sp. SDN3]
MENKPIKIAIVGPESTGKSIISEQLARFYGTVSVPEYSREYCRNLNRAYTLQDELNIYYGQLALERSLEPFAVNGLMFCDTTFLTVKVWCDYLFGNTPEEVLSRLKSHAYDYYLLMNIDLPWEDDPLRDFPEPEQRTYFLDVWKQELTALQADYQIISGVGEERFTHARQAVDLWLGNHNS